MPEGAREVCRGLNWGACLCTSWAHVCVVVAALQCQSGLSQQCVLLQAFSAPPRPLHPRLHCLYLSR